VPGFAGVAASNFLATWLGLHFTTLNGGASLVWPSAGLALALLLRSGMSVAPALLAGSFAAALVADMPVGSALGMALLTTLNWVLVARWLRSRWHLDAGLPGLRDVWALVAGGAFAGAALSASLGTAVLAATGGLEDGHLVRGWLNWWAGDLQGVLYVAPVVLAWSATPRPDAGLLRRLALPAGLAVASFGLVMLSVMFSSLTMLRFFGWFPLFGVAIWAAISHELRELVLINLAVAALVVVRALVGTVDGYGMISGSTLFLHGFLTLLALTTLAISASGMDRRRALAEVRASESRFRRLAELSSDWVWEQDADLRFGFLSAGLSRAGVDPATWLGRRWCELEGIDVAHGRRDEHFRRLDAREPFRNELFVMERGGADLLYFEVSGEPFSDAAGRFAGYRGVARDVTQQKRDASRIEAMAMRDALTGLPNRIVLGDRLSHALVNAERHGSRVAVMFIDLDGFKQVNDTHGHAIGDRLLCEAAGAIGAALRRGDTLARMGGDEFVVVLEDTDSQADAERVAAKILAQFAQPLEVAGVAYRAGASIGIALYPGHGADQETLLRHADAAMYRAKAAGRGRYAVWAA